MRKHFLVSYDNKVDINQKSLNIPIYICHEITKSKQDIFWFCILIYILNMKTFTTSQYY